MPDLGSPITGLPSLAGVRLTRALLGRSGPQQPPIAGPWTAPQPEIKLPGQHRRRPLLSTGVPCQAMVLVSTWASLVLPRNTVLAANQSICWSPHICSPVHTGLLSLVQLTGPFCIQHNAAHARNLAFNAGLTAQLYRNYREKVLQLPTKASQEVAGGSRRVCAARRAGGDVCRQRH